MHKLDQETNIKTTLDVGTGQNASVAKRGEMKHDKPYQVVCAQSGAERGVSLLSFLLNDRNTQSFSL